MLTLRVASMALRRVAPVAAQARWKTAKVGAAKKAAKKPSVVKKPSVAKKASVVKKTAKKAAKKVTKKAAKKVTKKVTNVSRTKNAAAAKKKAAAQKAKEARAKLQARKRAAAARAKAVRAKLQAKKKKAAAAKVALKEKKDAAKAKKAAMKACGASHPFSLFVQQTTKGSSGKIDMKQVGAQYKALSAARKASLVKQAKANLAKRQAMRRSQKRPASKYAVFVKTHFKPVYDAELKKASGNHKVAFRAAAKVLSQKYKSQ